jgi:hypothetical protein
MWIYSHPPAGDRLQPDVEGILFGGELVTPRITAGKLNYDSLDSNSFEGETLTHARGGIEKKISRNC